jgi:exodeoxyribonuclease V beta subunit
MTGPQALHLTDTPLTKGTSLIEASAGTGKTYAITALFIRLILQENLSVREILVVTYTKAATEELRHRIRQTLAKALLAFNSGMSDLPFLRGLVQRYRNETAEMKTRLEAALLGFDEAPIFTIHGFCQLTLKDRAFESGSLFDTELVTDISEILQEIGDDYWRKHFYVARPLLAHFALKNGCSPERLVELLRTCLNHPFLELRSAAKDRNFESLGAELESRFQAVREVWNAERNIIKSFFGANATWGNKPYNRDPEMGVLFEQLEACFSANEPAYEALACFKDFCSDAIAEGTSKRSKESAPVHRFFKLCEALSESEKIWLAGLQVDFVRYAKKELPRRKVQRKIQSFDDLLTRLHEALIGPSGSVLAAHLRSQYPAALIDEFQDTDPVQYEIFSRAFSGSQNFLFLIGDPKQAIYGFRGADIFTYLEAAKHVASRFTLGENWRSEARLVKAVNALFSAAPKAFVFDGIHFLEAIPKGKADEQPLTLDGRRGPPLQFWFYKRDGKTINKALAEETLPRVVAGEITRLLNGNVRIGNRRLKPEDIAVLVLENRQAQKMQEALSEFNIPSVLHTTASLFNSHEALELRTILAAVAQPGDERLVKAALATDLLGVDGAQLSSFTEIQWQEWLQRFHDYFELWSSHGFFRMFRRWLQQEQVRQRLLAFRDGERRLTNVLHLGEVLHQAEMERRLGISGLLKWVGQQMSSGNEATEEHQLRLERDENAVKLVTIHKSKGLEYPVVFCPFSWKNSEIKRGGEDQILFHDADDHHQLVRDLGPDVSENHRRLAMAEKLAENVRLLYVALTRAKHRCYFVWGGFKYAATAAPAWLFHQPEQLQNGIIDALKANFGQLTDERMRADLGVLQERSDSAVKIGDLPQAADGRYLPLEEQGEELACREFKGLIPRDWLICSFSYLTAGRQEELPDRDNVPPTRQEEIPGTGIFAFPRGTEPGTCLHDILERLDFAANGDDARKMVTERLQAHGLVEGDYPSIIGEALNRTLHVPLDPDRPDFTLSRLTSSDRLNELEFYFPIEGVSLPRLQQFFEELSKSPVVASSISFTQGEAINRRNVVYPVRSSVNAISGFLKGFIDLVFKFEGRYYIVDWKSNWLGNRVEDYSPEAMRAEMERHQYFVQYHLYTVALHKYLALRLPDYDYEKHFGGVIYLFLRGLDPARPEFGIFRDRPPIAVINRLSELLAGKGSGRRRHLEQLQLLLS